MSSANDPADADGTAGRPDAPPEVPPAEGVADETARMQPDGTVGSARPAPPAVPVQPLQPLPLTPRRRSQDADRPEPRPVDETATSELRSPPPAEDAAPPVDDPAATPPRSEDQPGHRDGHGDAGDRADDRDDDALERTDVVPAVVVPSSVFDDDPAPAAPPAAAPAAGPPTSDDGTVGATPDRDGPRDGEPDPGAARRVWWRRPAVLAPAALVLLLAGAYGVDLAVAGDDVPRSTVVAGVDIGGLSPAAAARTLETQLAPRVTADHTVVADDVQGTLSPATAGITLDVEGTVDAADDQPLNPWTRLVSVFSDRPVEPVITGDETALQAQLEQFAGQVDRAPADATIAVEGTTAAVVPPVDGRVLDRAAAAEAVTAALASGGDPATPIELPVEVTEVRVDADEAQQVLDGTVTPALSAPVTVSSEDGSTTAELSAEAIAAALRFSPDDDGGLAVALDPAAVQSGLGDQLGEFGSAAQDAGFQVTGDSIAVVPSVDGTGIDPAVLAGQLLPALTQPAPRGVTATLGPVPAAFTTEQAEALGVREQISTFTTNFTNPASGTNIRVAAAEVDGALVRPGETFSLNDHTGPRTEAQGYVPAGVINNGEFTTGVGGGVSQFATTMFNAVFFAGLEDVFHKPHSFYISRYPAGREATVYYDSIDLQWRNDSDTGVFVDAEWVPGALTVTFWGTRHHDVESLSSDRYNIRTPVVQEKPDDGNCSPQAGSNGFDITVTRVFSDPATGQETRREDFRTRYAAEPVIRCVPVAPTPAPGAPAGTPAPTPAGRRPGRGDRRD